MKYHTTAYAVCVNDNGAISPMLTQIHATRRGAELARRIYGGNQDHYPIMPVRIEVMEDVNEDGQCKV